MAKNRPSCEGSRTRPTDKVAGIEVTDNFEPFNQRNDVFCRSRWDETMTSETAVNFFRSYEDGASPRKGDGFLQKDYALRNVSWFIANDYASRNIVSKGLREGLLFPIEPSETIASTQVPVEDKAQIAEEIKHISKIFGDHLFDITDYADRSTYTTHLDSRTMDEVENTLSEGLNNVIVMGVEMDKGLMDTYPLAVGVRRLG
jgi:epoxyqueuosine reductase